MRLLVDKCCSFLALRARELLATGRSNVFSKKVLNALQVRFQIVQAAWGGTQLSYSHEMELREPTPWSW